MRSSQKVKTSAAIGLALAAIAPPAAFADSAQSSWVVQPNPDQQANGLAPAAAARPAPTTSPARPNPDEQTPASAPVTIVRVGASSNGFDWGDAGVGAAGGLALAMLGFGGALAVSQRRSRRTTALPH